MNLVGCPIPYADFGGFANSNRSGFCGKELSEILAVKGHTGMAADSGNAVTITMRTTDAVSPSLVHRPLLGRLIIWELAEKLKQRDSFSM